MRGICLALASLVVVAGCATITNDAYVPVALSLSDGSAGTCQVFNKRMAISAEIPGTIMVRRSDDNLNISCETLDGRKAVASVPSEVGAKIIASAVFMDFGIVDSITDKHRNYPSSFVIPIKPQK